MFLSLKLILSTAETDDRKQSSRREEAKKARGGAQRNPGRAFSYLPAPRRAAVKLFIAKDARS
jgi:hypothetical protein